MLIGYHRGIFAVVNSMVSSRKRSDASTGKRTSFCACTSLRMSACTVPRSFFTTPGPKRRLAAATYIASRIGAGPLIVIDAEKLGSSSGKPA
jgi:hypothetical protein